MSLKKEMMLILSLAFVVSLFGACRVLPRSGDVDVTIVAEVIEPTETVAETTSCIEGTEEAVIPTTVPLETLELVEEEETVAPAPQVKPTKPVMQEPLTESQTEENAVVAPTQPSQPTQPVEETVPATEEEFPEETTKPTGYVKPAPVKVEITKAPDKVYYAVGEKLNTVGMMITVTYDNNKTKNINNISNEVVIEYGENTVAIHYAEDDKVFTNHITVYGAYEVTYKPGTGIFQIGNYPNKVLYTAKGKIINGEYMEPKMAGMYFDGWYTEDGDTLDSENLSLHSNIVVTAKFVEPHR